MSEARGDRMVKIAAAVVQVVVVVVVVVASSTHLVHEVDSGKPPKTGDAIGQENKLVIPIPLYCYYHDDELGWGGPLAPNTAARVVVPTDYGGRGSNCW